MDESQSEPYQDDESYYAASEEGLATEADPDATAAPGNWDSDPNSDARAARQPRD